ncbi:MAG: hypothetical protein K9W46_03185 [Candidatus Heimdallarchaeum endolithica]|uniref:Uncharacterized protein n=1 Tax=Candidatus Heimdallarchaeum endolithica TaxID=2876572 RepID=A0A9Y1BRY5_9ARCH|nr:MAG: hypothetical protein K9W46_03185 [Candidatus Heimdallarchaeum endolithica]
MSSFPNPAIEDAISSQDKSLLLIDKSDICAVLDDEVSLDELLWEKLWMLQERKISFWKDREITLEQLKPPIIMNMPIYSNGKKLKYFIHNPHPKKRVSNTVVFIPMYLLNEDYETITLFTEHKYCPEKLNKLLSVYNYIFGFSAKGSFGISQESINWSDFGVDTFIKAFREQEKRYSSIDKNKCHSSENLVFVEPLLSTNSFFILEIYSRLVEKNQNIQKFHFRQFEPTFLINRDHNTSWVKKRVDTLCEICGLDSYVDDREIKK